MDRETYETLFEKLRIDPYDFMGLSRSSSGLNELKKQYKVMAKELHPDRQKNGSRSAEPFKILNACYAYLSESFRNRQNGEALKLTDRRGRLPGEHLPKTEQPWLEPVTDNCMFEEAIREAYTESVPEDVTYAAVNKGVLKPKKTDLRQFNNMFEAQKQDYITRRANELTVWKEPQAMESCERLE